MKRFLRGFKSKKASSPLIDDSNTPHHPKKQEKTDKYPKSRKNLKKKKHFHKIAKRNDPLPAYDK